MELYEGRRRPKNRKDALKIYVMSTIADDYEDFDMVTDTSAKWAKEDGWEFTRQEILGELAGLIHNGHAQAFVLSVRPPYAMAAEYSEQRVDDLSFYLTPKGIEALRELDIDPTL